MADTINEPQRKRHQDGEGYRDEGVDVCPGNRSRVAGIIGIGENYAEDGLPQRVSYISRTQQATRGGRTQTNVPGRKRVVRMLMLFIADVSRCASQAMSEVSRLKSCRLAVSSVLAGNERVRSDYLPAESGCSCAPYSIGSTAASAGMIAGLIQESAAPCRA